MEFENFSQTHFKFKRQFRDTSITSTINVDLQVEFSYSDPDVQCIASQQFTQQITPCRVSKYSYWPYKNGNHHYTYNIDRAPQSTDQVINV